MRERLRDIWDGLQAALVIVFGLGILLPVAAAARVAREVPRLLSGQRTLTIIWFLLCVLAALLVSKSAFALAFNEDRWLSAQETMNLALLAAGLAAFVTLIHKLQRASLANGADGTSVTFRWNQEATGRVDWMGRLLVFSALCLTLFAMLVPRINSITAHPSGQYWWLDSLVIYVALLTFFAGRLSLALGVLVGMYELLRQLVPGEPRQANSTDLDDKKEQQKAFTKVLVPLLVLSCLPPLVAIPLSRPVRITAFVTHSYPDQSASGSFDIMNQDSCDWTDVHMTLNACYRYEVASIGAGERCEISDGDFSKNDGTRFDLATGKILTVLIQCRTPKGDGVCEVKTVFFTQNALRPLYNVAYAVTGTATSASVTYTNEDGGTSQEANATLPWKYSFKAEGSFETEGPSVYLSAQNDGETGDVTVTIYKDYKEFKTSTSKGAHVIATAEGTLAVDDPPSATFSGSTTP
jgi:hypothetical protein